MISFRALLAAAPLLALAVAQNIAFTSTPAEAVAGQSYNITWGGGDGTAATVTLRRGNPQDLSTISTLADSVMNNYYVWTVSDNLQSGDDYALQITQGQSDINYSGLFSVSSGSANSSSSSASSSASTTGAAGLSNSTATMTGMTESMGTGTAVIRNSTFSSATLTSSSGSQSITAMSTTSSHSSATRSSSASSSSTSAPSNDASIRAGSSAALILGIVAAVMLH